MKKGLVNVRDANGSCIDPTIALVIAIATCVIDNPKRAVAGKPGEREKCGSWRRAMEVQ